MEMATTRKTKTTTTSTAKVSATATGNGNPYTQNLKTVKQSSTSSLFEKINCYKAFTKERTKSRVFLFYEIQNNKTEIKISKYKQRNYLKFLINLLYLIVILIIKHINKSILKLLLLKTKATKFNLNNYINNKLNHLNDLNNCKINNLLLLKQQKIQHKKQLQITKSFKTFSFKFKIVIKFLTNCYHIEKYVKILLNKILHNKQIIRNFIGICPKRLISLKRLQQIPDKLKRSNYGYASVKERLTKESWLKRETLIKSYLKFPRYCLLNNKTITYKFRHFKQTHRSSRRKELNTLQKPYTKFKSLTKLKLSNSNKLQKSLHHIKEFGKQNFSLKHYSNRNFKSQENLKNYEKPELEMNFKNKFLNTTLNCRYFKLFNVRRTHFLEKHRQLNKHLSKRVMLNKEKPTREFLKQNRARNNCFSFKSRVTFKSQKVLQYSLKKYNQLLKPLSKRVLSIDYSKRKERKTSLTSILCNIQESQAMYSLLNISQIKQEYSFKNQLKTISKFSLENKHLLKSEEISKDLQEIKREITKQRDLKDSLKEYKQLQEHTSKKEELNIEKPKLKYFTRESKLYTTQRRHGEEYFTNTAKSFEYFKLNKDRTKVLSKFALNINRDLLKKRKYIDASTKGKIVGKHTLFNNKKYKISNNYEYRMHHKTFIDLKECGKDYELTKKEDKKNPPENFTKVNSRERSTNPMEISSTSSDFLQNSFGNQTSLNASNLSNLANPINSKRTLFLHHKNNSFANFKHFNTKATKLQKYLKKCQHFLYSILFYYNSCLTCCCCLWHIYGFPLVLVKILKYLKDSTVHVLTRRLKISSTKTATTIKAAVATTSIDYNYSNSIAACGGKLKKPTKMSDYKANNQQNVLKTQTSKQTTATKTFSACAYSSFSSTSSTPSCSTTSLTASSTLAYRPTSPGNLILLLNQQPHKMRTPYCHYQQQQKQQHYQQNRQQLTPQQQQEHQPYNNIAASTSSPTTTTILHLQLPSLLVFSRTLIILILLSSLWHTSEGFHSSGVKLSTNTVKTKYGLVRGIVVRSSPSLVEAYLGIPYASPPVGSLRFMPPITPSTWKNVRNADRFSPVCPQNVPIPPNGPEALLEVPRARLAQLRRLLPLLSNQSEDCLYLNIYVPYENRRHRRFTTNSGESTDSTKLPTILFIHGESYEWNSGNPYDGSELAAHGNVIVVTINFRLGILGFLKTGGKESAQGNFGLMDLVAGLHWLKENLPAFGGDPQAITLLGHGTGAALANILVVSPVASDLIQHTVLVSGSALSPWAIQKNPLFVKRRVAEQTGCHGDMLYYDLAPCLRTKSLAELLAVKIDHPRFLVGFAPFIDGTVISPNTDGIGKLSLPLGSAIVSTSGIEYANFPKRNLIFCLTSVESHLDLSAQDLEFGFNETRRDRILRTYVRNNFHYHLNEIFAVLKNEYTDWDKAIRSPLSSRDATLQFLSDGHTASSLIKLGYMHSLRGGRGYFLHFKHRTVEEEYPQRTGSVRGEDVPFWLGLPISPLFPHNYTTQEKQISRLMLRYLANFAKTGNPNQSTLSSPQPSSSSLISGAPSSFSSATSSSSSSSSTSSQTADDTHDKVKRSSYNIVNASSSSISTSSSSSSTSSTSSGPIKSNAIVVDVATAAAREALNLAVLYNQRRTKRTYYKRHSRSNDDHSGSASNEVNYFLSTNNNNNNRLDSDELPFWDAYDVVNQLYMELGSKAEIQSHYRGHKLSMWLNLIPQLHRHANMNDQSMRHHQFQDDLNNLNLYEGIVRAQIQIKPDDDEETILLPKGRPTPPPAQETNTTQKPNGGTTECGVDGAMFVAEMTTVPPSDNHSLVLDSREKEMATASTGLIGNLEVLRRLSGKQFQSYTTALVATVAVGCFLLILNILIFAGIYHQREKRARDAKTKEELQDNDTSKNSSMLKLNALGSETGSFNGSGAGVSGKTTVVFGEYSCYDEKSLQTKDEKLIVELPPPQMVDPNWAACSTSTLDLLKTKHHTPLDTTYTLSNVVPINTESQTEHLMAVNAMEMATYNPMSTGLIIDPSLAATTSTGLLSKRGSFVGSAGQLNQYDFASVQSSDQMSFKDIENAVKASATMDDDITHDDDIPEPPPPPRSFHSMQQQQQQGTTNVGTGASGSGSSGGGGILRQAGTTSGTQTGGGKKRVHIQEISV